MFWRRAFRITVAWSLALQPALAGNEFRGPVFQEVPKPVLAKEQTDSVLLDWVHYEWKDFFKENDFFHEEDAKRDGNLQGASKPKGDSDRSKAADTKSVAKPPVNDGSTLVYKETPPGKTEAGDAKNEGRGGVPPGRVSPPGDAKGSQSQAFAKYWPVCIFIDPVNASKGNDIVKGMVQMAAACSVNLVPYPITIKSNYPEDPDEINRLQQASCNIVEKGKAPAASTVSIQKWPLAAAKMCDSYHYDEKGNKIWHENTLGCAEVRPGGMDQKTMDKFNGYGEKFAFGKMGSAFPGIVVPKGANAAVSMHEAIGHSMMGWPNHEPPKTDDAGLGIGRPNAKALSQAPLDPTEKLFSAGEDSISGEGFNGIGCAQMQKMGIPNDGRYRYNASKQVYYRPQMDPKRQWQLGRPLWRGGNNDGAPALADATPPVEAPPAMGPIVPGAEPPSGLNKDFFRNRPQEQTKAAANNSDSAHKMPPSTEVSPGQKQRQGERLVDSATKAAGGGKVQGGTGNIKDGSQLTYVEGNMKPGGSGAEKALDDNFFGATAGEKGASARGLASVPRSSGNSSGSRQPEPLTAGGSLQAPNEISIGGAIASGSGGRGVTNFSDPLGEKKSDALDDDFFKSPLGTPSAGAAPKRTGAIIVREPDTSPGSRARQQRPNL